MTQKDHTPPGSFKYVLAFSGHHKKTNQHQKKLSGVAWIHDSFLILNGFYF